ncbi:MULTISPECIES: hypothetical protein [unclassified Amycolatopsis]|uniref:hypothetical protein n=1 Tax=unclassified Amycolatopsis TaxID=2618356 RepID=UPI0028760C77|nr:MULTISPECIES: hypothetical protein [unclassified Amycolatopsis]MDS0140455.1 hypothetical protein [Amycolatopsis sp. 505]MDS0149460.1 hypothetical protein [Amycolatopsis sp. CM201R]
MLWETRSGGGLRLLALLWKQGRATAPAYRLCCGNRPRRWPAPAGPAAGVGSGGGLRLLALLRESGRALAGAYRSSLRKPAPAAARAYRPCCGN